MIDVFRGYNALIQPTKDRNSTAIVCSFSLQLILLISVVSICMSVCLPIYLSNYPSTGREESDHAHECLADAQVGRLSDEMESGKVRWD